MGNWSPADLPGLTGRSAMITGTGGIGLQAALGLARAGCNVTLLGRNAAKGAAATALLRDAVRDAVPDAVPAAALNFELVDLASLASIEAFSERALAQRQELDVLINNAGVMAPPHREHTADGFELQMGTNHLGHFALTARMLPLLRRGRTPRVINVSSIAHHQGTIDFTDLQSARRYRPMAAYRQSKLANLLFSFELQRRSNAAGWGVASIACHPGVATTDLFLTAAAPRTARWVAFKLLSPLLFQSAAAGALPLLYAAASTSAAGGGYYGPDGFMELKGAPTAARVAAGARDTQVAARLWEESVRLTHAGFGP